MVREREREREGNMRKKKTEKQIMFIYVLCVYGDLFYVLSVSVVTMPPVKCIYNGKTYHAEEVFNSTDNCNLCDCTKTGQVKCTQKTCRREPGKLCYYKSRVRI